MTIQQGKPSKELKKLVEKELEKYEEQNGVSYNYQEFSFCAEENGEVIGAAIGFTCFSEVYIDELVVMEGHRGKDVGTQLVKAVEERYRGCGFHNINLCTNEFQAPKFYEKLGFQLEFVRENRDNPKLNKYFYAKFF